VVATIAPFQVNVYGVVPPDPIAVTEPLLSPLHNKPVKMLAVTDTPFAGSSIMTHDVSEQPIASVTVTQCTPASRETAVAVG